MEESFFAQVARGHRCRGHQAAQCIRDATSLPTRSSEGGFVIGDLLPTNARLRTCLQDANQNLKFLQCACLLCLPTTRSTVKEFDVQLAQAIANPDKDKDGLRRCFAVLALAGGHFTFRAWDACSTGGELLPFLNGFLHPGVIDSNLRLFAPLVSDGIDARQLAEQFIECVRGHCWLTDIPRFDVGAQSKVFTERKNLPFTHVIPVPSTGTRPGKLFRKVLIDPDYTGSDVLKRPLFLKRLSFAHNDHRAKEDAQREIDNLFDMKRLNIPGVAELLFAFTTFDERQQHKHLVFHLYEFDLEQVLLSRSEESLPQFFQWSSNSSSTIGLPLSRHPLWESAMDLLAKIARIHDPPQHATGLEDGLILQVAHLDLKPANIVIDKEGKLLLIDLEHAIFNVRGDNETSSFDGRAGTFSYAPPEGDIQQTHEPQHRYGRSYDVWSLGCVLLEIMTCILCVTGDGDSVPAFRAARSDDSPGEQHSAFWRRVGTNYEIKDAVKRKIEIIAAEFGPRVADQLRKMLAIEKAARPKSLQDCITEFTSQGDLDELTFVRKNEIAIFATKLSNVTVSFTTERRTQPYKCELQLFRSFELDAANRSLTLVLLCGDQNRRVAVPLSALANTMVFVPTSHFDASVPIADALGSASGVQCRISGLHDGTTFHFPHARDFRLFQTLVTYQQSCLTRESRGIGIKFDSMSVRFSHRIGFRNDVQMFGAGHVQVLYRLSDREYQEWVLDRAEAARLSTARSRSSLEPARAHSTANGFYLATSPTPGALPKSASTYRLALYTTTLASPPKRVCIVYNLDRQDCLPSVDPQNDARKVTFRENFLAAIYEASHDTSQDSAASYPGYPVIPDFLDTATSDRDSSLGKVIKKMDLIMNTAQDCKDLMSIIKRCILDTP